jgi:hypothetical protein
LGNGSELIIFPLIVSTKNLLCRESEADSCWLAIALQANVNPKAELANDFEGKRRAVHLGSCNLMREDLKEKAAKEEAKIKVILLYARSYSYVSLTLGWYRLGWMKTDMERFVLKTT